MTASRLRRFAILVVLIGAVAAIAVPSALAAPFTVTKEADTNDLGICAPTDCSLRDAISAANAAAGDDTITLPAGHYTLTLTGAGEDGNATGDLDVANNGALTITGAGARTTTIDGNATDRVFDIQTGATLSASGVTIANGAVASPGHGGGILNRGSLTLTDSAVSGNVAGDGSTCAMAPHSQGGGIQNEFPNAALLVLNRVAVTGNRTDCYGGGIDIDTGTAGIVNSTIAGNNLPVGGPFPPGGAPGGAGVDLDTTSPVSFVNDTIAFNTIAPPADATQGGGIWMETSHPITFQNTIVAANTPTDCNNFPPAMVTDPNLDGDSTCFLGSGAMHSATPGLAPLADNGGPTDTVALLSGSPAIDTGLAADCPPIDQRGTTRPQGPACDLGAFELAQASPPEPNPTPNPNPTPSSPSNQFIVGAVKRNTHTGTATITVTLPGAGQLTLGGKGVKPILRAGASARAHGRAVSGAGAVKLLVKATGKTKTQLNRTGKATVNVKISFTPTGGTTASQAKTVRLKKRL